MLLGPLLVACGASEPQHEDELVVGLLLPFTGSASATGANFERSVLMAAETINREGGVRGKSLRIVSRDTHSELARSQRSAEELIDSGAVVILGPESADLASDLSVRLRDEEVVFVSPYVGDAGVDELDCNAPWFRLSPSAETLGEALAKDIQRQGAERVAILSAEGSYDSALARAAQERLESRGIEIVLSARLDTADQSYATVARQLNTVDADAVLLSTSPRSGALLINEQYAGSGRALPWYLSPLLKTELFTLNVVPEAIAKARGVAPRIFDESSAFPNAFADRWQGDAPLEGAYFYFDALNLVALALERGGYDPTSPQRSQTLRNALIDVASPPGEAFRWNELGKALRQQRRDDDVYYSGLTGPLLLDECGSRALGVSSTWLVVKGRIETVSTTD